MESIPNKKIYYTFYFIASHLKTLKNIEIVLDSSLKCLKPLRKLIEKEFKDKEKQYFIVGVYAIDFKPELIKPKEIKDVKG